MSLESWEDDGGATELAAQQRWQDAGAGIPSWGLPCPFVRCDLCVSAASPLALYHRIHNARRLPGNWCLGCIIRFWEAS